MSYCLVNVGGIMQQKVGVAGQQRYGRTSCGTPGFSGAGRITVRAAGDKATSEVLPMSPQRDRRRLEPGMRDRNEIQEVTTREAFQLLASSRRPEPRNTWTAGTEIRSYGRVRGALNSHLLISSHGWLRPSDLPPSAFRRHVYCWAIAPHRGRGRSEREGPCAS